MGHEITTPTLLNAYNTYITSLENHDEAREIKSVNFYIKGNEVKCLPINEKMTEKGFKKISTAKVADALYKHVVEQDHHTPSGNFRTLVQILNQSLQSKKAGPYSAKTFFSRVQNLFTIHRFKTSEELMRQVDKEIR
jgi:hypothetical protein